MNFTGFVVLQANRSGRIPPAGNPDCPKLGTATSGDLSLIAVIWVFDFSRRMESTFN